MSWKEAVIKCIWMTEENDNLGIVCNIAGFQTGYSAVATPTCSVTTLGET
jgi:ADP-ribosylglycohydrolase